MSKMRSALTDDESPLGVLPTIHEVAHPELAIVPTNTVLATDARGNRLTVSALAGKYLRSLHDGDTGTAHAIEERYGLTRVDSDGHVTFAVRIDKLDGELAARVRNARS
jgi:hypothetical protein